MGKPSAAPPTIATWHRETKMVSSGKRITIVMLMATLMAAMAMVMSGPVLSASAKVLLSARLLGADGKALEFRLSGESREQIIGGMMELGSKKFEITKVSRSGLIGGNRSAADASNAPYGEFAIFSSSFSMQTAQGEPWVAAQRYIGCSDPYNSFLALYHVTGEQALAKMGASPYQKLTDDASNSQESDVYCFMSKPPSSP